MRDCASQEVFQSWPRWDFSEDDDKQGKKKTCFDLTHPVSIREKQSLENPSPQSQDPLWKLKTILCSWMIRSRVISSDLCFNMAYPKLFMLIQNLGSSLHCEPRLFRANPADLPFGCLSSGGWRGDYCPWVGVLSQQIKHCCPSWSWLLSQVVLEDLSVPSLRDQFSRRQMACGLHWSQETQSVTGLK